MTERKEKTEKMKFCWCFQGKKRKVKRNTKEEDVCVKCASSHKLFSAFSAPANCSARFHSPRGSVDINAAAAHSGRKPAVTGARYKYLIPGEIGSQINSTRGHINDGVVKISDSPKGDC